MSTKSAAKFNCSTIICALIYLFLIFGGYFSPSKWCVLIELVINLASDIANNPYWDYKMTHTSLPKQYNIPPTPILPSSIPFEPSLPIDMDIPIPRYR